MQRSESQINFRDCIKKLSQYTSKFGWKCKINSWIRKDDESHVWVIILTKGPVAIHATGSSLKNVSEKMLGLLNITEAVALAA